MTAAVNRIDNVTQAFSFIWIPLWKFFVPKKYWEDVVEYVCSLAPGEYGEHGLMMGVM